MNKQVLQIVIFFLGLHLLAFSCGVNTGNPGFVGEETKSSGTTLLLDMKPIVGGQLRFQVKQLLLIPEGELLTSTKAVALGYAENTKFYSGQTISLVSQKPLTTGNYDRMVLILDSSNPATFIDGNNQEAGIAIAPYQYYAQNSQDATTNQVQLVFSVPTDGIKIGTNEKQTLELEADLSENFKAFDAIAPAAYDYYKSIDQVNFQYTLDPNSNSRVKGNTAGETARLNVSVTQTPLPIQFICVYTLSKFTDPTTYINDEQCALATSYAEVSPTAAVDQASFILPPDSYIALARDSAHALIYQQQIVLKAGDKTTIDIATGGVSTGLVEKGTP